MSAAPSPPFPPPLPPQSPSPPTTAAFPPPPSALLPPNLTPPTAAFLPPPSAPSPVPAVGSVNPNLALGVGLGVGLGVFVLIVLSGFIYYLLRRRRNSDNLSAGMAATDSSGPTSRDILSQTTSHKGDTAAGVSTHSASASLCYCHITLASACDRAVKRWQGQTFVVFLRGR